MTAPTTNGTRAQSNGIALACATASEKLLRAMLAHERVRMDWEERGSAQAAAVILRELHARGLQEDTPQAARG